MVRLAVSVEGSSEEKFISQILRPYFKDKNIIIQPILFKGSGGGINLKAVKKELNNLLNSFDIVTTFYDFYGFQNKQGTKTKEQLESKILEKVSPKLRTKLIPYIQAYEFEALLFSEPNAIGVVVGFDGKEWGKKILNNFSQNPEMINNSFHTSPKHRIENKGRYSPIIHANKIIAKIGLKTIRQKCQGFNEWLTKIEGLN